MQLVQDSGDQWWQHAAPSPSGCFLYLPESLDTPFCAEFAGINGDNHLK